MDLTHDYTPPKKTTKAYKNQEFLNSPCSRTFRVMCEMIEPRERFKALNIQNTIVMFGSARMIPLSEAKKNLKALEGKLKNKKATKKQLVEIIKARAAVKRGKYYDDSRKLAKELALWNKTIKDEDKKFHICSGGGPGIMEAANRGAYDAKEKSVGLGISLPFEQGNNKYIPKELSLEFHYFFIRKYWFLYMAKAIIVFPGGFGTMDEMFEVLTLSQTEKTKKIVPMVLYGSEFWNDILNFDKFVEWGTVSPEDLDLFKIIDGVDEAKDYVTRELTEHYL